MINRTSVLLILLFFSIVSHAENTVLHLNITQINNEIKITPSLNFKTSDDIKEAIDNGIRVDIIGKAELYKPNSFWFNNTIAKQKINLEVSYFTLSELYVVKNKTTGEQQAFTDYQQLWQDTEKLIVFNFLNINDKDLWIKVRVMLDEAALPTAMQLPILFNSNWRINTAWHQQKVEIK